MGKLKKQKKEVRMGLIGCGRWGRNHAKVLAELPCLFIGIADSDTSKREFAEDLDVQYFENYEDLLPLVDAVVVATPTSTHFNVVAKALKAGKHVLVEKPVTLDSRETAKLVSLAHKKGLILSVGYIYRFHPVVQELKKRFGRLKNVHYITARYIGGQNRLWQDSGAIINFGIHLIDTLNFLLDERPERVYAKKQNLLDPDREDSAVVKLVYPSFFVSLELSCVHPQKERDMWIIADNQKIYADFNSFNLKSYQFRIDAQGRTEGSLEPKNLSFDLANPLLKELDFFLSSVAKHSNGTYKEIYNVGREEPNTTLICETALKSALSGKELKIRYPSQ